MIEMNAGKSIDRGYSTLEKSSTKDYYKKHESIVQDENVITEVQNQLSNTIQNYPKPPSKGGVTETMFGVKVEDPWRALEVLESEETQKFIKDQNECSNKYLNSDLRKPIEDSCKSLFQSTRTSCPMLQGDGYYYWLFNDGKNCHDIMIRSRSLEKSFDKSPFDIDVEKRPEIFFDPNEFDKTGKTSLFKYSWNSNGKYFIAILQNSGSDWQSIKIMNTKTFEFFNETLIETKFNFGVCWIEDYGFIYKRIMFVNKDDEVVGPESEGDVDIQFGLFFHSLNTKQKDDVNIWRGMGKKGRSLFAEKPFLCSSSGDSNSNTITRTWLCFTICRNTNPECEAFMVEITNLLNCSKGVFSPQELKNVCQNEKRWIARGFEGDLSYVGTLSDQRHLFISTISDCSLGRIISISEKSLDSTNPDCQVQINVYVPENNNGYILEKVCLVGKDLLVLIYLRNVCAFMIFVNANTGKPLGWSNQDGTGGKVESDDATLPDCSSITSIFSRNDSNEFCMSIDTWTEPAYILKGTFEKDQKKVHLKRLINDPQEGMEDFVCKQIFYSSHDGIQIPMFICHSRSLKTNIPHRTLLYAYGGFSVPLLPHYDPFFIAFMRELNGVVAIANVRGGNEFGEKWHKQGMGKNRINGFEDLAFAAKYLHSIKITKPSLTAIYGTSNGGTLMMANVNRNPNLFGVCMADAGISDLIRFPLFSIGKIWQAEYGSPRDPKMFPFLFSISPLHNIVKSNQSNQSQFPAIFITHGDNDSRVIPGNSLKYLAEFQNCKKGKNGNPILGKIYNNTGHELVTKSTKERVEEAVDRLVFCLTFLKS